MRGERRLLVIGAVSVATAVGEALFDFRIESESDALAGVWRAAREDFDAVLISLTASGDPLRAVETVRELKPNVQLLVSSRAVDEPRARDLAARGADGYLLEPVLRDELRELLKDGADRSPPPPQQASPAAAAPDGRDLARLGEVLQRLDQGPAVLLQQFAEIVRDALSAVGVRVRIDDHTVDVGDVSSPILHQTLRRDEEVVGEIALSKRTAGTYDAGALKHLGAYARVLEVTYALTQQQSRLREMAWTDDLSGLRNRRYFDQELSKLIERARRDRSRVTVLLFDIDEFKQYNDEYGHQVGDRLIQEVAELLTRTSRETDIVARYGGDEFAVIFWDAERPRVPGSQHPHDPHILADRFCRAIHEHRFECLGPAAPGPVTISGGLASFPWDGRNAEEVLQAADEALLAAKRSGKNRIQLAGEHTCALPPKLPDETAD